MADLLSLNILYTVLLNLEQNRKTKHVTKENGMSKNICPPTMLEHNVDGEAKLAYPSSKI